MWLVNRLTSYFEIETSSVNEVHNVSTTPTSMSYFQMSWKLITTYNIYNSSWKCGILKQIIIISIVYKLKKSSTIKSWPTFCDQYFWKFPIWNSRAEEKRREKRMVKVNVIFNDIRLLICLTPLQVNWVMVIN